VSTPETIEFHSEGETLRGVLHRPARTPAAPSPTVIEAPAWLSVSCASAPDSLSEPFHEGLVEAGFAVISFDYRGFGASGGESGWIDPEKQIEDVLAAVTFVENRPDLDASRIGLFGIGALGAGNAIYAAANDPRIRCVVVQSAIADARDWLRGMRRRYEWHEFLDRVAENRRARALGGEGVLVDPREEIMLSTPERAASGRRQATDERVGGAYHLASVDKLLRYRPIDVIARIGPRAILFAAVDDDVVTPAEHTFALFNAARPPKRLIVQRDVGHYESYRRNYPRLMEEMSAWYRRYLDEDEFRVIAQEEVEP
jgi:dipeptidyl aminopeptidase/acylaminoacyl peptidase